MPRKKPNQAPWPGTTPDSYQPGAVLTELAGHKGAPPQPDAPDEASEPEADKRAARSALKATSAIDEYARQRVNAHLESVREWAKLLQFKLVVISEIGYFVRRNRPDNSEFILVAALLSVDWPDEVWRDHFGREHELKGDAGKAALSVRQWVDFVVSNAATQSEVTNAA